MGVGGIALTTLGLAAVVAFLGISTQTSENPAEAVAFAVAFALPFSIVVRAGHLGRSSWRVPTPGAFVFIVWQLGLAPSMVSLNAESYRTAFFSSEAVVVGRIVFFAWFLAYALALGRAPAPCAVRDATCTADRQGNAIGFTVLLGLWAAVGAYAIQYNMLSTWGSIPNSLAAGSVEASAGMLYGVLTAVVIPVALLVRLRGGSALKIAAHGALLVGAVALFVYSQRRLWIFVIYLCLSTLYLCRGAIKLRWVVAAAGIALIGVGPLVWVYRGLRHTKGVSSSDAPQQALQAVIDYSTNEDARADANLAGTGNLATRLNISVALFGATEHVLRSGANWSPSILEPVVRSVPTVIWPDKNDVATSLSARAQLLKTGRFPEFDLAVSPVTEFVFELGVLLAPFGGALYGFMGRLVTALSSPAIRSLPIFVIWASLTTKLCYFDSGTNAIMSMREPLGIALVLEAMIRIFAASRSSSTKMAIS